MRFELWVDNDRTSYTFSTPENIEWMKKCSLFEKDAKFEWSVEADGFEDAMVKYHEYMGFKKYRPMND